MKKREAFLDEGQVIASMNVEGMPWYSKAKPEGEPSQTRLAGRELRSAMLGAVAASLAVVGVISAGIILLVLFCLKVWLKY